MGDRNEIIPAGKNLADGADHAGDMFDAVDNHILVIDKDNVTVLAHDFNNE